MTLRTPADLPYEPGTPVRGDG
ncbi:MAG: hypothetical protein JWN65_778, partial [Solirubrobacterales bacterium]|nr:hypothetical protein [Solirubrobacterales bacterium]